MSEDRWQEYPLGRAETLLAFGGVMLGLLLAALNQTIVTTAAPQIVSELGGLEHYSWIFTAYMLASAVTVPIWGRLSDIYGRRLFFAIGTLIFMAGALVGATAGSMGQLVAARAIQGLGAGALIPLAMAVIGDLVPPADRGRWQGLVGVVFGISSVVGPATGGLIVDHASWRWVFIPALPLGAIALAVSWRTLKIPPHPDAGKQIDYLGAALLTAGLSSGLLALVSAGEAYAWGSVQIIGLFATSAVLLGLFAWQERRVEQPIVPVHLYAERLFKAANAAAFLVGASMFATIMFVPLFVQGALGDTATASGIVLTPLILSMIVMSVLSGQIISRTGRYRWALLTGPLLMIGGFVLLLSLDVNSGPEDVVRAMIVMGLGLGLLLQNLVVVIQNGVPSRFLGAATSAAQFSRVMGGTIGVTVLGAVLTARFTDLGITGAELPLVTTGVGPSLALREDIASAIHPIFVVGLPLMVLALIAAVFIPEIELRKTVREESAVGKDPMPLSYKGDSTPAEAQAP